LRAIVRCAAHSCETLPVQNRSVCCRKRASTTADVQKMTQAEDAVLQFFIFHRTSDYSRHEPFARVFNLGAPAVLSSRVFAIRTAPADIRIQRRSLRRQGRKAGFCLRSERRRPGEQPCAIALADRRLMGIAGLWETRRSPAGERIRSFTIITARPNEFVRRTPQPYAGGPEARNMAGVARRTAGGRAAAQGAAGPLPFR
jgi:SOS response associated peptidase (SRAP)